MLVRGIQWRSAVQNNKKQTKSAPSATLLARLWHALDPGWCQGQDQGQGQGLGLGLGWIYVRTLFPVGSVFWSAITNVPTPGISYRTRR